MNVLSLFDGMSCGQLALNKSGIKYDNYYASEIEAASIKVTLKNYPNTIQLGDICNIKAEELPAIDLLIGGSPCQSFSHTVTGNKGFDGKSKLFFEYLRLLKETKPKFWLLENVEMKQEWEDVITEHLGVTPIHINSSNFSAQNRPRVYWTNIPVSMDLPSNKHVLEDILEPSVDEKYFYKESYTLVASDSLDAILHINGHDILKRVNARKAKCHCLTAVCGGNQQKKVLDGGRARKLTPLEYERLQCVPDGYTACVSDSARYKMLGNGWTVDVISYILNGIKI
jgi:DNA (cytosine-5)-methyltransferase 3A